MIEETQDQDIVYSLATSPSFARDGLCFAACRSGLIRSDDGGISWRSAYDALDLDVPLATTAVAVSPTYDSDQSVFAGVPGGILRSVNGGQSWLFAVLPSPPPIISTLVTSPDFSKDGTLLAGTVEDGIYCSVDRGAQWSAWNFGLLDLSVLSMAISPCFANDETVFVGTESGIFCSTNGGRAWREVGFPTEFAPVLSLVLSPGYAHDGILWAGTESFGAFCSDDRGQTWRRLGEDFVTGPVNAIVLSPQFPAKPHVLVMLSRTLLVSRDGGRSWSNWNDDLAIEQAMTCITAPQGLDSHAPLLIGLHEGGVRRI